MNLDPEDRGENGEPRAPPLLPAIRLPPRYQQLPWWRRVVEALLWWPRWAMRALSPNGALERWVKVVLKWTVAVAVPLVALVAVLPLLATVVTGIVDIALALAKGAASVAGVAVLVTIAMSWLRRG